MLHICSIDAFSVYIGRIVDVRVLGKDCSLNLWRFKEEESDKTIEGFWVCGYHQKVMYATFV